MIGADIQRFHVAQSDNRQMVNGGESGPSG